MADEQPVLVVIAADPRSSHRAFEALRIGASGRNLFTSTPYNGLDPEVSNFGNRAINRNIDVAPFPPSRQFWLTVEVGF